MNYSLPKLMQELAEAARQGLPTQQRLQLETPNSKVDADLALPCFALAKELGKSPAEIATEVAAKLQHEALQKAEAAGGFVNIWLKPAALAEGLQADVAAAAAQQKTYGWHTDGQGKTVIVEFPSPNMAKPFSVGHLRPAVQGWAVRQLLRALGYDVITDNHLGDWGTPFGKWVLGFQKYSSDNQLAQDGVYELARVYVQMTADLKAEVEAGGHELTNQVQAWLLKLEQGDPEAKAYAARFSKISLDHMHQVLGRLNISTDYEYGEAFYIPKAKELLGELVGKGVAVRQADGSIIAPLDDCGIDTPMLLQKSNGAALYATSDLATLEFRDRTWHPDRVVYVVAAEQQFHFQQVFALAHKLGYKTQYVHYWFGLVDQLNADGTRSKMSSRQGVVLLEDLLDQAEQKARELAADGANLDDESIKRIALGAIKFTDFAQDKKTSILFDWQRIFNLQGFSGPYVQYAAVRIGAILAKFGEGEWQDGLEYDWQPERELLMRLALYPEVVRLAGTQYEPHRIAQYAYELARTLNRYYETTPVGNEQNPKIRAARLWLLGRTRQNFTDALDLLGIAIPAKM